MNMKRRPHVERKLPSVGAFVSDGHTQPQTTTKSLTSQSPTVTQQARQSRATVALPPGSRGYKDNHSLSATQFNSSAWPATNSPPWHGEPPLAGRPVHPCRSVSESLCVQFKHSQSGFRSYNSPDYSSTSSARYEMSRPPRLSVKRVLRWRSSASTFPGQTVFEGGGPGGQNAALGQSPLPVLALHRPALPPGVTSPGAGHPGARHPLGARGRG